LNKKNKQNMKNYHIAGFRLQIADEWQSAVDQLPGFAPFLTPDALAEPAALSQPDCQVLDGQSLPLPDWQTQLYDFDYEESRSVFGTIDGGYRLTLKPHDAPALHLWTDATTGLCRLQGNAKSSLVRFALWTALGIALARKGAVAIHASCLVYHGKAVLCLGESGTGKSTHTRLWRTHILGTTLLNDDSPWVRIEDDGQVRVYGSPWSGKTPCYRDESYPLAGCIRLSQAPANHIRRLPVVQAYGALHPSAPPAFAYDETLYDGVSAVLSRIVEQVPVYHLECLPDEAAAQLSRRTLFPETLQ
jgi:hypothetical protein